MTEATIGAVDVDQSIIWPAASKSGLTSDTATPRSDASVNLRSHAATRARTCVSWSSCSSSNDVEEASFELISRVAHQLFFFRCYMQVIEAAGDTCLFLSKNGLFDLFEARAAVGRCIAIRIALALIGLDTSKLLTTFALLHHILVTSHRRRCAVIEPPDRNKRTRM